MDKILEILKELNETNSNIQKKVILAKYIDNELFGKVLRYTYDKMKQFNVTCNTIKSFKESSKATTYTEFQDLFSLLDSLDKREITGHSALKSVNVFMDKSSTAERKVLMLIIDRNLKIRVNAASINKVKQLIPTFDPVLSQKYEPTMNITNKWYISRKLDGVRCLMKISNGEVTAYSRSGKKLYNLENIINTISEKSENVFLDGELIYMDDDTENFTKTIEIVRKSKTKTDTTKLFYNVFDVIPEQDFYKKTSEIVFTERQKRLKKYATSKIHILDQVRYNKKTFEKMQTQVVSDNWEGLMLRKDVKYEGKRTKNLLKVKTFHDQEFKVLSTTNDTLRFINSETGLEESIECLSSVSFDVDGVTCHVGSGFSLEERKEYYKHPENIISKMISVKYFEKTDDGSLRFPVFLCIRNYE